MKAFRCSRKVMFSMIGGLALLSMAVGAGPASAADINSLIFPGVNQISDNSGETLLNCGDAGCSVAGGVPGGSGGTTLDVGDKLVGIFTIHTIEGLTTGGTRPVGSSGNDELTGIFSIQLNSKTSGGGCPNTFCFAFGPSATFSTDIQTACGGVCTLPSGITGAPVGTMIAMFDDPTIDYSRTNPGGRAGNLASAYGGSLYSYFGFNGSAGEFWASSATTDDINVLRTTAPPGPGGQFDSGTTRLPGGIMIPITQVDCANPLGGGTVQVSLCTTGSLVAVGGVNTDWHSWDDVNATFAAVPEPASVLLLGAGLAGLGFWRLRRNQAAKA